MSNIDGAHGFRYLGNGRSSSPHVQGFDKPATAAVAIFKHDVVYQLGGASGEDAPPIKSFNDGATPGATIPLGVNFGAYGAALTKTRHDVIVDLMAEYEAQDDDDSVGIIATDLGKNSNVAPAAGVVASGESKFEISKTGVNVSNARDLQLLYRFPVPDNVFGPHCRIVVKFNTLRQIQPQTGV